MYSLDEVKESFLAGAIVDVFNENRQTLEPPQKRFKLTPFHTDALKASELEELTEYFNKGIYNFAVHP